MKVVMFSFKELLIQLYDCSGACGAVKIVLYFLHLIYS